MAFRFVARAQPEAIAVCSGSTRLTYRDLDERSDRMTRGLARVGVTPGSRVGVLLDRDERLVILLLAVLKAGAAYVPIDPHYPPARRDYMTTRTGVTVIVTSPGMSGTDDTGADSGAGSGVARYAPEELDALGAASDRRPPGPGPDTAAYIIFTSGSSGRPKGVIIPHRNVIALVAATTDLLSLAATDVWTLYHSVAFDFSVWEIWGCLLTGGRLVAVPFWTSRTPAEFYDLLVAERVTVVNQTPSAFAPLIAEDVERNGSGLIPRLVILGGEPLATGMLADWFRRHPPSACRVLNMFGITETTVHVTAADIGPEEVRRRSRAVGRPLPGWTVSVRDGTGAVLPPGVPGEIYVGGAGVAIGYAGEPDLTRERFLSDPTGERLYRSGDLGRLLPDGSLEHLGRMDDQVKVRGFRIELEEIRSVLLEDSGVADAAVVVRDRTSGTAERWLAIDAYVVLSPGHDVAGVRDGLARMLPEHMIPTTITTLDALPRTANGKLDRAALPPPTRPGRSRGRVWGKA